MKRDRSTNAASRGFTILELMLSIAVFVVLVTSAFSLLVATTELIAEISELDEESANQLRFVETCRFAFEEMTAESVVEFDYVERTDGRFDTYLSLVDTPAAFDFGANAQNQISRVVLAAETRPDGFKRSGVYYFTSDEWEEARKEGFADFQVPYVQLLPRLSQLDWEFYDPANLEWKDSLDVPFSPSMVRMTLKTENQEKALESVFWFLSKQGGGG